MLLLSDNFDYSDGLITNEYVFWNPTDQAGLKSPLWEMGSGSFYAVGGKGWTGVPDNKSPNSRSTNGNNSSVFRLNTKRSDFENVSVSFSVLNQGLSISPSTPAVAWDGLHVWLRYQSETSLYYCSVNRRDNTVVIKKKVPGGPSNGGTYYELSPSLPYPVPYNIWKKASASVLTNPDGSVTLSLYDGATLLLKAVDDGKIGGPPIKGPGKVGIRGDNANLKFDDFTVEYLPPVPPTGEISIPVDSTITISWKKT